MNQNNRNNFINETSKDEFNRQVYQKIMSAKRLSVTCFNWSICYIFLFVLFITALIALIVLICLIEDEHKDSNFKIPIDFWGFIVYFILDFIFLEIVGFALLKQSKELKKEYHQKIKKLSNLYLIGLFLIVPSFIASILMIPTCKKINKEIDAQLCARSYD